MSKKSGGVLGGSDGFMREQLEASQKEAKALRARIDHLQRENDSLKRSLFELSTTVTTRRQGDSGYYDLSTALMNDHPAMLQRTKPLEDETPLTIPSAPPKEKSKDSRHLYYKYQLTGHTGAVYTVKFSPNGKMLASGSFDKTVRIWDSRAQKEVKRLEKHTLNVSDLCWARDSASLISSSFDQTCNLWEVETGKALGTFKAEGFVQTVGINPADENVFFCGTTRKYLSIFDKRKPAEAQSVINDSMVNSLYASKDGMFVTTGDSAGLIKTWDLRNMTCVSSIANDNAGKPISHIHVASRLIDEDEESRYLAVNSFDNVLRVYDRGSFPPKSKLHLLHSVKGHRNQNWPIKSSFFHGKEHETTSRQALENETEDASLKEVSDDNDLGTKSIDKALLLATGSADTNAYIFDVGGRANTGELIQKLEGHMDRVYSVNFHPTEPILATCSADFTIKVWFANRRPK